MCSREKNKLESTPRRINVRHIRPWIKFQGRRNTSSTSTHLSSHFSKNPNEKLSKALIMKMIQINGTRMKKYDTNNLRIEKRSASLGEKKK